VGSRIPAPVSSATFGPDSRPVRSTSSVPGSAWRRRPVARVVRACPVETPSTWANMVAASRWPVSRHTPEASTRRATKVLPAIDRRSRLAKDP
jgi:hypothetical protein